MKFKIFLAVLLTCGLMYSTSAFAGDNCFGVNCNKVTANGGEGGAGGEGGNAEIKNSGNTAIGNTMFGDTFSPKAEQKQDQEQKQAQGQFQIGINGQMQNNRQVIAPKQKTIIKQKFEAKRNFANGAGFVETTTVEYAETDETGPQVVTVNTILDEVSVFEKVSHNTGLFQMVRVRSDDFNKSPVKSVSNVRVLKSTEALPTGEKTFISFLYAEAIGDEASTADCLKKAVTKAFGKKGNILKVVAEGHKQITDSTTYGIGVSSTGATVQGNSSGTSSAGLTPTKVKVNVETKPWIQFKLYYIAE